MRRRPSGSVRLEVHRRAVHAIAIPRRLRPIGEHVAKMAAALAAMHFGAAHEEAAILGGAYRAVQRLVEAGPTSATFEFCIRSKQLLPAAGADEFAVALLGIQRTGAGALRAMLAQHLIGGRRQLRAPLFIGVT